MPGEDNSVPNTSKEKKKGDQSDLVQGLRVVYDTLSPQPKKGNPSVDPRKGRLEGESTEANEIVDIIAVPGLGANPAHTWVKRTKIDPKEMGSGQRSDRPMFKYGPSCIEDKLMLQAQIPKSRIMIFEYVSQWWGEGAVEQYLHQVAEDLARALKNKRKDCPKRPIIFIGHSLGGIVVEKTILWAKSQGPEFADVFESITGCIFLGTPFTGSEAQAYAATVARVLSTKGIKKAEYNSLLEVLRTGNQYLVSMLDDFSKIVVDSGILTHCFFELQKTNLLRSFLDFATIERVVAPAEAATLRGRPKTALNLDHSGLSKFDGPTDENWKIVCNEIKDMVRKSARILKSRQNVLPENLDDEKYHEIMNALSLTERDPEDDIFSVRHDREEAIKETSKLVLENHEISSFLNNEQQGALWVDLHSGMDTAMTAVALHQEMKIIRIRNPRDQNDRQLCYFFCDDTDLKKNNTLSILKAFIRQMIAHTRRLALHLPWDQNSSKGRVTFESADTLIQPFLAMLRDKSIGNVDILINNIHMVDDDDRKKLLHAFSSSITTQDQPQDIDKRAKVKWICIGREAERPDLKHAMRIAKHITSADLGSPERLRDALKPEVARQVRNLAWTLGYKRDIVFWLRTELLRRAEGNVTWVNLACNEIHCVKPSPIDVRSFAESLRQGLTPLYRQIEKRVLHTTHDTIEYTKEILRTMMIVVQHPTPDELAVLANLPDELHGRTAEIVEIIERCGSFLTIKRNPKNMSSLSVEFIDVSAREYLQRESASVLGLSSEETQHGVLALRCLTYLMGQVRSSGMEQLPFESLPNNLGMEMGSSIVYPSSYWINHAMKAVNTDVVEDFDLEDGWWHNQKATFVPWWPRLSELARNLSSFKGLTVVHLAAYFNYSSLLEHLLSSSFFQQQLESKDSLGRRPLAWAVREGHLESAKILVEHGADIKASSTAIDNGVTVIHEAIQSGRVDLVKYLVSKGANLDAPIGVALFVAAAKGTPEMITYLLSLGVSLETTTDFPYGNAVGAACMSGNIEIMRILVEKGCHVNVRGEGGSYPLQWVAHDAEAISFLIAHGANKEHRQAGLEAALRQRNNIANTRILLGKAQDLDLRVPFTNAACYGQHELFDLFPKDRLNASTLAEALFYATEGDLTATVKSLLQMGADPNKKAGGYGLGYALPIAAASGSTEIIRMLLNAKADPNVPDLVHGTALQAACFEGNIENVRLLLPRSNKRARSCGPFNTALCAAISGNHKEVVELLLSNGWDVNDDDGDRGGPILAATAEGHLDITDLLLKRDVDVKVTDLSRSTPLILGAGSLPAKGIEMLVQRGCDITEQNMDGVNPLIAASKARATETVQLLLKLNAERGFFKKKFEINHCSDEGSALYLAAKNGDEKTCEILIRAGASAQSKKGPLPPAAFAAAESGDFGTFMLLHTECGCDANKYEKHWGDIIIPALRGRNPDIYEIFLDDTGRDIDAVLQNGAGSVLHLACLYNLPDLVQKLFDMGADPNVRGGSYHTTLQAASYRGNPDIVQMLLDHGFHAPSNPGGFYKNALNAAASKNHVVVMRMLMDAAEPKEYLDALFYAVKFRAIHSVEFLLRTMFFDKDAKVDVTDIPFEHLCEVLEEELDEEKQNTDDWLVENNQLLNPEHGEADVGKLLSEEETGEGEDSIWEGRRQNDDGGLLVADEIGYLLDTARRRVHQGRT